VRSTVPPAHLVTSVNRVKPDAGVPEEKQPEEIRRSVRALKPEFHRFHGAKLALSWFPFPALIRPSLSELRPNCHSTSPTRRCWDNWEE
jgi:hypothetical protein